MKKRYSFFSLLFIFISCLHLKAQSTAHFTLHPHSANLSFVSMDSANTSMCTVIEYPEFLSLIEVPLIDGGGGRSKNLKEDTVKCLEFIDFLNHHYKNKPVRYIFSSHWHLHSLSGISPFFRRGALLVTTANNWKYSTDNGLLDKKQQAFYKQIIFVRKDTALLAKTAFPVNVWYLDSTYKNKPTPDYLFFYMPKIHTLHASCMCPINDHFFPVTAETIYNDRLTDLYKAIDKRKVAVDSLIRLSRIGKSSKEYRSPTFTYSQLKELMDKGSAASSLPHRYADLELSILQNKKDSILLHLVSSKMPADIVNNAVYLCIRKKEYSKALVLAQLLNLYAPGTIGYIDTLGETCFLCGDLKMAVYYDQLITGLNLKNEELGLNVWKSNQQKNN